MVALFDPVRAMENNPFIIKGKSFDQYSQYLSNVLMVALFDPVWAVENNPFIIEGKSFD